MGRKLVAGGVLVLVLAMTSNDALAGTPRAALVKKADAICRAESAKVVTFKNKPPNTNTLFTSTPKQLKAQAGWWSEALSLFKEQESRLLALGAPNEPVARSAWTRWHFLTKTVGIPFYAAVVSATKRGDLQSLKIAFSSHEKEDNEAAKLIKGLGLKACQFS
jgi:hypothetical protein